jgi:hypothetical protein
MLGPYTEELEARNEQRGRRAPIASAQDPHAPGAVDGVDSSAEGVRRDRERLLQVLNVAQQGKLPGRRRLFSASPQRIRALQLVFDLKLHVSNEVGIAFVSQPLRATHHRRRIDVHHLAQLGRGHERSLPIAIEQEISDPTIARGELIVHLGDALAVHLCHLHKVGYNGGRKSPGDGSAQPSPVYAQ